MKDSKLLKITATFLSLLLIVQSCKMYDNKMYNKPLSVSEAVSIGKSVSVTSKTGEKNEYDEIYYENNQLFGKRLVNFTRKKTLLNEEDISTIYLKDPTLDNILVGLSLVTFGGILWGLSELGAIQF
jgi:hypothetical protein